MSLVLQRVLHCLCGRLCTQVVKTENHQCWKCVCACREDIIYKSRHAYGGQVCKGSEELEWVMAVPCKQARKSMELAKWKRDGLACRWHFCLTFSIWCSPLRESDGGQSSYSTPHPCRVYPPMATQQHTGNWQKTAHAWPEREKLLWHTPLLLCRSAACECRNLQLLQAVQLFHSHLGMWLVRLLLAHNHRELSLYQFTV